MELVVEVGAGRLEALDGGYVEAAASIGEQAREGKLGVGQLEAVTQGPVVDLSHVSQSGYLDRDGMQRLELLVERICAIHGDPLW
jgi:hypothetical protein